MRMNDLISRKYLFKKIAELENDVKKIIVGLPKGSPEYLRCMSRFNELNEFKSEVRDAPTVETRAHGKWINEGTYITTAYGSIQVLRCSNCELEITVDDYDNFCPNCGADMRSSAK